MKKILVFTLMLMLSLAVTKHVVSAEETVEDTTTDETTNVEGETSTEEDVDTPPTEEEPTVEEETPPVVEDEVTEEEITEDEEIVEDTVSFTEQINDFLNDWFTPIFSALSGVVGALTMIIIFSGKVKKLTEVIQSNKDAGDEERKKNEEELKNAQDMLEQNKTEFNSAWNNLIGILDEGLKSIDERALSNMAETNNQVAGYLSKIDTVLTNRVEIINANLMKENLNFRNGMDSAMSNFDNSVKELINTSNSLTKKVSETEERVRLLKDLLVLSISSNPDFATNEYGQKMLSLLDEKEVKM